MGQGASTRPGSLDHNPAGRIITPLGRRMESLHCLPFQQRGFSSGSLKMNSGEFCPVGHAAMDGARRTEGGGLSSCVG